MANCQQEESDYAAALAAYAATLAALTAAGVSHQLACVAKDSAEETLNDAAMNHQQAVDNLAAAQQALEDCQNGP